MFIDFFVGGLVTSTPAKILESASASGKQRRHRENLEVADRMGIAIARETHRLQQEEKKKNASEDNR